MLVVNVDSGNLTCTTVSLPRQMLTTNLFTMHFVMIGFRKVRVL